MNLDPSADLTVGSALVGYVLTVPVLSGIRTTMPMGFLRARTLFLGCSALTGVEISRNAVATLALLLGTQRENPLASDIDRAIPR